jgi:hypothetical protein
VIRFQVAQGRLPDEITVLVEEEWVAKKTSSEKEGVDFLESVGIDVLRERKRAMFLRGLVSDLRFRWPAAGSVRSPKKRRKDAFSDGAQAQMTATCDSVMAATIRLNPIKEDFGSIVLL